MFWPSGQQEARPVFQAAGFRLPERIRMKMRPDHGISGKRAYDKAPAGSRRKLRSSFPVNGVENAHPGARASRPHHVGHSLGPLRHLIRPVPAPWASSGLAGAVHAERPAACLQPPADAPRTPAKGIRMRAGRPRSRVGVLGAARADPDFAKGSVMLPRARSWGIVTGLGRSHRLAALRKRSIRGGPTDQPRRRKEHARESSQGEAQQG